MNVILYVIDCLRADHIGALGYRRNTTPVLDGLAAQGVLFSKVYAQSGWTAPSAASLLSSRPPAETGIHKMRDPLNPHLPWLPEILQEEGYRTAAFSGIYQVSRLRGFHRGFHQFRDLFRDPETIRRCRARGQDARGDDYCLPLSEDLHLQALGWLDARPACLEGEEPFFMLLWSIDTHEPYRHPFQFGIYTDPDYLGPVNGRGRPFSRIRNRRDLQQLVDLYDESLRYQDEKLGEFLEGLHRRGVLDETLVVVLGDHGEMFFEHGIAGHGKFPWEEEIAVPLLMHCPQALPRGRTPAGLVQLMDVAPTILDVAGFEEQPRFAGRSLRPLFEGERDEIHDAVLVEVPSPFDYNEKTRVLRTREWKYVEHTPPLGRERLRKVAKELGRALTLAARPGLAPVLYGHYLQRGPSALKKALFPDLRSYLSGRPVRRLYRIDEDPGEKRDLAAERPLLTEAFAQRLAQMVSNGKRGTSSPPRVAADGEAKTEEEAKIAAHLAQLGYIEK